MGNSIFFEKHSVRTRERIERLLSHFDSVTYDERVYKRMMRDLSRKEEKIDAEHIKNKRTNRKTG